MKRVKFNLQTAKCGLCPESERDPRGGVSPTDDPEEKDLVCKPASVYCKTCRAFVCVTCLRTHRKLVITENHVILNRDHVLLDETISNDKSVSERDGNQSTTKVNETQEAGILKESVESILEYERQRLQVLKELSMGLTKANKFESDHEENNAQLTEIVLDDEPVKREQVFNFSELCSEHTMPIKHFCQFHKQLCCDVCKFVNHRLCSTNVNFLPSLIERGDALKAPFRDIEAQVRDFKEYDRKLQGDLKQLRKSKDIFLHDLKEQKRDILNWINLMEVRAIRRLEITFDKCKRDIEAKRRKARQACESLRAEIYFLKEIMTDNSHEDIYRFIKIKRAENHIEEIRKKKEPRNLMASRFKLNLNKEFDEIKRNADQLFEIGIEKNGETKYNIRLKEDENVSNITGCDVMSSGALALADSNNARVKLFDSQIKLIGRLSISGGVFDLTSIGPNALAVTCPLKGAINIVQIRPEMEIVKTLSTGTGTCWGVRHHDGLFVVNCSASGRSLIRGIDIESSIVFQINTKCNFFSDIQFPDEGIPRILIASVTSYTEGNETDEMLFFDEYHDPQRSDVVVREYNLLKSLHTRGVTSDRFGNIVVCCKDVDQIYTISGSGGDEAELLLAEPDGLAAPQAICYNQDKTRLFVTSENTDFIQIFDFER
ncbi:uncharacterized protein LOC127861880 [Dreissena polymorpha]|uniref:B box-type domain-containing protein n=1 Tax=Dreissena polymorpha TaxID=45954 RepID=A0A9D3Y8L9_DREPO|nr:uncharacterized protein LOC127861880 [Dreissena polymorpha]KAH3694666.1 hypothetical protein DPMN_082107 [Dreissena polymorpha]